MAIQVFLNAGFQFLYFFPKTTHRGIESLTVKECSLDQEHWHHLGACEKNKHRLSHPIQTNGISTCVLTASLKDMYTQ